MRFSHHISWLLALLILEVWFIVVFSRCVEVSYSPLRQIAHRINMTDRLLTEELHIPSSPISASSFDPMLAPGTIEAVYGYYNANKVILVELAAENEKYLQMWSERFASPAQPGQTSTSNIPPVAGLAAVPFSSIHHGYVKSDQLQPSAIQFSQAPDPGQPGPPGPYFNTPKYLSAPSGPRQQNGMQSPRAHSQFRPVSFQDRGPRKNASLHTKKKVKCIFVGHLSSKC